MTARFETYRNIIIELSYNEKGFCCAVCDDPIDIGGVLQTYYFYTPKEAFESMKKMLDRMYWEVKQDGQENCQS